MQVIDSGNLYLNARTHRGYANLWQLALVDIAVRIWAGLPKEVRTRSAVG
jgi:hypothetical protein